MMKKHIALLAAILMAGANVPSGAQTPEDISKQLEVTRAYTPRVGQASKISVVPNMVDTVRLHPEISYSITPTPWQADSGTRKFDAASIDTAPFDAENTLYVRGGIGYPFQTTADVYFTPRMHTGSTLGMLFNHRGSYSKIENDIDVKAKAAETYHKAGLWGSRRLGRSGRYTLQGDASYDIRSYDPYGVADMSISTPATDKHLSYDGARDRISMGRASGQINFGDTFSDLSHFNFRAGIDGGYSHYKDGGQVDVNAGLSVAQMFHPSHGYRVGLSERGAFATGRGNARAVTVALSPRYVMSLGVSELKAGFDVRHVSGNAFGQSYVSITPYVDFRLNLAGGRFVPFFTYTSRMLDGSHEALSRLNPYLVQGSWAATGQSTDLRVGFEGDFGDVFTYRLSGGMSDLDDRNVFIVTQDITTTETAGEYSEDYKPARFLPSATSGVRFTAGAELGLHNLGGFAAKLYGNWNKFETDSFYIGLSVPDDMPRYDAGARLSYRFRDVFFVELGAELVGDREYAVISTVNSIRRIDPVVDVSFEAEVKVMPDFWVFVEGHNLAGQKLYPYPVFRGLGADVIAGVKLVF